MLATRARMAADRGVEEIDIVWDRNAGVGWTLTNGNTTAEITTTTAFIQAGTSNAPLSSGKWYWEILHETASGTPVGQVGISKLAPNASGELGNDPEDYAYYANNGDIRNSNTNFAYGDAYNDAHVIGVALDMDNRILWFSKNGVWQAGATLGEIEASDGSNAAATGLSGTKYAAGGIFSGSSRNVKLTICTKAADLTYMVPSGFKPLAQQ